MDRRLVLVVLAGMLVLALPARAFGMAAMYRMKQMNAVTFAGSNTAFAVGLGSSIIRSTNGGKTWSYRNPGVPFGYVPLQDIAVRSSKAIAVGWYGTILQSSDSGDSWTRRTVYNTADYLEGVAIRDGLALAVGGYWDTSAVKYVGVIYRSTDGGKTWTREVSSGWDAYLKDVTFIGSTAWISSSTGQIYTTADGHTPTKIASAGGCFKLAQGPSGVLWNYTNSYMYNYQQYFSRMTASGTWAGFYAPMWVAGMAVRSTSSGAQGWMVGGVPISSSFDSYPAVLYSSDAHAGTPTWTTKWQSATAYGDREFRSVAFSSGSQGLVCGAKTNFGWMMRTADGGAGWTDVTTKVSEGALAPRATLSVATKAKPNKSFSMSGTLRPGHDDSSELVEAQKKSGSKWKSAGRSFYLTKSKYTTATYTYKGTGSLPKGTYRLRLKHAAETWYGTPAVNSSWRTIVVK